MSVRIDLDEIESKSRPIEQWDEERDAEGQECVTCKGSMHTPSGLDPTALCNHCAQKYAADTAPVVLALVARIKLTEGALRDILTLLKKGVVP